MFPIEAPDLKNRVLQQIVPAILRDNVKSRILRPDGTYYRLQPGADEPRHRSQEELMQLAPPAAMAEPPTNGQPQALVDAAAAT
jgi:polyphosphate kinase